MNYALVIFFLSAFGNTEGTSMTAIDGFASEKACLVAAEKVTAQINWKTDRRRTIAICVAKQ